MNEICSIELAITISQLNKILSREIKQELEKEEITDLHPTQIKALFLLKEQKSLKLNELAKNLSLTKPTVTVLVQKLDAKGYIKRKSCREDKRCSEVSLTNCGEEIITSFKQIKDQIEADLFSEVSEDELCSCLTTLQTIINNHDDKG
jgi:DNA-binding MarR family transcriptional regulator